MPEPDLLLEVLIVALDPPAQLGGVDQIAEGALCRKRREPIFGRLLLALRPFDQQPFLRSVFGELAIVMRNANTHTRKARGQARGRAFSPFDRAPGVLWQAERELLDCDRPVLGVAAHARRRSPLARPRLRRQRPRAGRPCCGARQNAGDVSQIQSRNLRTQPAVVAIPSVQQHHAARQTDFAGPAQLIERDLRLGLEDDLLRYSRFVPTLIIRRPVLRQIQPIRHRQAGIVIGDRQRYRYLAVVLLAELATILARNADRVPTLLGKARVVDDPRLDRPVPFHLRQHQRADLCQYLLVRPTALTDEMQQRLMLR